jgi:predicted ATPase
VKGVGSARAVAGLCEEHDAYRWLCAGVSVTALEIARRQGARSLELRAAVGLSRLWRRQGRAAQARQVLAETCGRFTEGQGTRDLREARAVLAELTGRSR